MAHAHAGMSPAEARRLARQIDRAAAVNPVPFQYRARFRAKDDAPFGAWHYMTRDDNPTLPQVFNTRRAAETAAAKACPADHDTSIVETPTDGF